MKTPTLPQFEIFARLAFAIALITAVGCRQASFSVQDTQTTSNSSMGTPGPSPTPTPTPSPGVNKATETFTSQAAKGKVDILFVDDNSASMELEQASLGNRFSALAQAIQGLDWQVGITTTDCSSGKYGICGDLLPFAGSSNKILTPNTPNYENVFKDTIVRPETAGCVARADCPTGNEEPLKAAFTAMDKAFTSNSGFFRPSASLAIVILTDEDEQSDGPPTATQPLAVFNHFKALWGTHKTLRAYAITTLTGDTGCLNMQKAQQGGIGAYGTFPMAFAALTGGISESICSPDYQQLLTQIGNDVHTATTDLVTVGHVPKNAKVDVKFKPANSTKWTVHGRDIEFSAPIPSGTVIDVTYEY